MILKIQSRLSCASFLSHDLQCQIILPAAVLKIDATASRASIVHLSDNDSYESLLAVRSILRRILVRIS